MPDTLISPKSAARALELIADRRPYARAAARVAQLGPGALAKVSLQFSYEEEFSFPVRDAAAHFIVDAVLAKLASLDAEIRALGVEPE